jgi:uncharacterized membrane protein YdbT with pleckstrin-like domain
MRRADYILSEGEQILFQTKHHKWTLVYGILLTLYSLIATVMLWYFVFMLIFSLIYLSTAILKITYTDYILTNRRFMRVSGFWFLHSKEYPLEKIDTVTFWQFHTDKWLNTGVVTLFGMGIRTAAFRGLARAGELRDAIHSQLSVEPVHYFD